MTGLKGLSYIDKTLEGVPTPTKQEDREEVTLSSWTDRVYLNTPDSLTISGVSGGKLMFSKTNLPDCVVWNPWEKKAGEMGDLGSENWSGFICVEAGQCVTPVVLAPGQVWSSGHRLEYLQ